MPRPKYSTGTSRTQVMVSPTAAPTFKPFHDRKVPVRKVVCPTCGAGVDVGCTTSTGGTTQHKSRRRLALRSGL